MNDAVSIDAPASYPHDVTMSDIAANDVPEVTLGWRLRMAMEHAHLKAEDMAHRMDVHRGTITRWTHDIGSPPRPIYLHKWAEICGVRYEWLAGDAASYRPRVRMASNHGCMRSTRLRTAHRSVACTSIAA